MLKSQKLFHIESDSSSDEDSKSPSGMKKVGFSQAHFETAPIQRNIFMNPQQEEYEIIPVLQSKPIVREKVVFEEEEEEPEQTEQTYQELRVSESKNRKKLLQIGSQEESDDDDQQIIEEIKRQKIPPTIEKYIQQSEQIQKFSFVNQTIEEGRTLSAVISRVKSGFNYFLPQLDMSFEDFKHILSCKKQMGTSILYYFSTSKEIYEEKYSTHCGKSQKNFMDNAYNIYQTQEEIVMDKKSKPQQIVCSCRFRDEQSKHILPKYFQIFLLKENVKYTDLQGVDGEEKGLHQVYDIGKNKHKISYFRTRKPQFCRKMGAFKLGFDGRVTQASVKNFILEDPKTGREVLMFGKNGQDLFKMDISHPLSPLVGLGVTIPFFSIKS